MRRFIFRTLLKRPLIPRPFSCFASGKAETESEAPNKRTQCPSYEQVYGVESLDHYRPGGYHPIHIGDRFLDRYCIVHKLGHGSYSTIWLAQDEQLARYVALKVGTADSSSNEAESLSHISASAIGKGTFGSKLLPSLLGQFNIDGPNGTHTCLVTSPARCSLADSIDAADYSPFQLSVARSLSAQLAMVLDHTHQLGYVHGGWSLFLHLSSLL